MYKGSRLLKKTRCINCGKEDITISSFLKLCYQCLRKEFPKLLPHIRKVHSESRGKFALPPEPPRSKDGVRCNICANQCRIGMGEKGFCGIRENREGKLRTLWSQRRSASVDWYWDPLPTNCVADWVCPGGSAAGSPEFSYTNGPEYGYKNLAVFYNACSFNCLFCQNWHYRQRLSPSSPTTAEELASQVDDRTSCVCYFGGDPTPQIVHALLVSRIALSRTKGRIVRICWETNGSMNPRLLDRAAELSLKSGGCVKFDLKAWNKGVHKALTGVSNKQTLANFRRLTPLIEQRPAPPLLIASTLMIPGYVDEEEVRGIAKFISQCNPSIPYALLAFHPQFFFSDLPPTSRLQADRCLKAAKEMGLQRVRIGNLHLLW